LLIKRGAKFVRSYCGGIYGAVVTAVVNLAVSKYLNDPLVLAAIPVHACNTARWRLPGNNSMRSVVFRCKQPQVFPPVVIAYAIDVVDVHAFVWMLCLANKHWVGQNDRGWTADIEFLTRQDKVLKVLEAQQ
jgi:hypothetical protein